MPQRFFYFTLNYAVDLHDKIIEQSGGLAGANNLGLLESALQHIQNDLYYPTLSDKLAHLVFAINKFHAFSDGNKRSSVLLGAYFLQLNGYSFIVKKFIFKMEEIAVLVAEGKVTKDLLCELIESIVFEDDYSESLKLKLFNASGNLDI